MSNSLNKVIFYANEAVDALYEVMGMPRRVYRGYSKKAQQQGDTIQIDAPGTFVAQDAPSTAQDIKQSKIDIALDFWKEVRMAITDEEAAKYDATRIRELHVKPAMSAIAQDMSDKLFGLYKRTPWVVQDAANVSVNTILNPRKVLFGNKAPMNDGKIHFGIDGETEAGLLGLQAFTSFNAAGQAGADSLAKGSLGVRFGVEPFADQGVLTHTAGVAADADGALTADAAEGDTSISLDGVTASGTFKEGDTLSIAGDSQRYAITADAIADGTGAVTLNIFPALKMAHATSDAVSISLISGVQNFMFHENAIALATAALPNIPKGLGAVSHVVTDPKTGIAIRARMAYNDSASATVVTYDILYGYSMLNPNLASRLVR